jgi:hypothetical protein
VSTTRAWHCAVCRSFSDNSLEAINNCTMSGDKWPEGCGFTEVYVVPVKETRRIDPHPGAITRLRPYLEIEVPEEEL